MSPDTRVTLAKTPQLESGNKCCIAISKPSRVPEYLLTGLKILNWYKGSPLALTKVVFAPPANVGWSPSYNQSLS